MSLRILLHSKRFLPGMGGIELSSFLLARTLTEMGHLVTVVTDTKSPEQDAFPFRVLRNPRFDVFLDVARSVDVIHAKGFSLTTLPIAEAARKPIIWSHENFAAVCLEGLGVHDGQACRKDLRRCFELTAGRRGTTYAMRQLARHGVGRLALSRAAANVSVSRFMEQLTDAPHSTTIYNAADDSIFHPIEPSAGRNRIVFVGRFIPEKGVHVLLDALAKTLKRGADLHVDLIGSGPAERELRAMVQNLRLDDRVMFHGILRGQPLLERYATAAAIAVPSTIEESFGLVAAEALLCGRLPLVSDRGALPEVVGDLPLTTTGGDADALATLMIRCVNDVPWRTSVEQRAVERGQMFTPRRQAAEFLALYERARSG